MRYLKPVNPYHGAFVPRPPRLGPPRPGPRTRLASPGQGVRNHSKPPETTSFRL